MIVNHEIQLPSKILNRIKLHVSTYPKNSVFLFGSRVRGSASSRSDIDIGFHSSRGLDSEQKRSLEEVLDNLPVLQKIDLVDFDRDTTFEFRNLVQKNIYYLN